jgi:nucleoid DNA-binding protein
MVRSEIISKLSDKIHQKLKKSELEKILNIVIQTIINGIRDQKSIELRNFGRFSQKRIRARLNARNPRTGETIRTLEKKSISFKMSKELTNKINKKESKIN